MYASLGNSYQWEQLNHNGTMIDKVTDIIKNGRMVTPKDIPTAMLSLKNKIKSPIMTKMLEAMDNGSLVLVYSPEIKVPVYLPFIVMKSSPNSCTGYVFLNNLDASEGDGEIFLNTRKLKVSMETCHIATQINNIGNSPKLKSQAILRSGSKIYSATISECINRKYSTKLDPVVHNSIIYLASRYYIGTILGSRDSGMKPDVMRNYCLYNCSNVDYLQVAKIVEQFSEQDFNNIATFISKLSKVPELQKRLAKLNVSGFLQSYINMYDSSMMLGLEVFTYFLYNVISVNESTYVNNYQVLKNIVGDDGKKLYSDLIVTALSL